MEQLATVFLAALAIYLIAGMIFAVPFALWGVRTIDPGAAKGTIGFKVLIIPGSAIFWPLLLQRWWRKAPPREEHSRHRALVSR